MNISTKSRYGLRALVDLAQNSRDGAISISSISKRQNISTGYLEQLMGKLKNAGIVISTRGASGGYELSRPATEISAGEILRALEGGSHTVDCPGLSGGCASGCAAKELWRKINDGINEIIDATTLQSLIDNSGPNTNGERKQTKCNGKRREHK